MDTRAGALALCLLLFSCDRDPGEESPDESVSGTREQAPHEGNASLQGTEPLGTGNQGSPSETADKAPSSEAVFPEQERIQFILSKANPAYQGQGRFEERDGRIVAAHFPGCGLRDLSPLRGLDLEFLDLRGNPVREIRHLEGMPLKSLWMEDTEVVDLKSLKEAKLVELGLNNSPVESLDGLQGQPLEKLYAVATRITDVEPLGRTSLRQLWLTDSPVSDLSPLAGLPLESLTVHRTLVRDLSFVRKLPVIQRLHIGETLIEDLTPLEGLRLTRLVFTPSRIKRGLDVARRLQGLREIGTAFDDRRKDLMPPADFWSALGK